MQFCFHQSSCQSCSEKEEELHPTHPIHLTTALGHNKIRNLAVRGSGSSHNIFPWCQHQVLPHSVRQITHTLCSLIPSKFKLQRCCRQMSSPGWFGHNQFTHPTPRCPQTLRHIHYLYCIVAEVFKGKASWPESDKVSFLWVLLTHFLVAELLKSISGHNFQAVFYDYEA